MGLNFGFSESQQLYRDQIRRFARTELVPMREKWDQQHQRPRAMVEKALKAGLLDCEMDHVMRGIMIEEVGYADFNCALPFLVTTEPFELNRLDGVPDHIRNPVRQAVREGRTIIAVGFTEPFELFSLKIEDDEIPHGDLSRGHFGGAQNPFVWEAECYVTEPVQQALLLEYLAYQKNLFLLGLNVFHDLSLF